MAATRRVDRQEIATQLRAAVQADPNSLAGKMAMTSSYKRGCENLIDPDDYAEFYGRVKAHIDRDSVDVLLSRFKALYTALKREADNGIDLDAAMSITEMVTLFEAAQKVSNG